MATSRKTITAARAQETGDAPFARFEDVTIASYPEYAAAEAAADWLSDHGFPVQEVAIVGTGLHSVEQVGARMTSGVRRPSVRPAGCCSDRCPLLLGVVAPGLDFTEVLLYSLGLCSAVGTASGGLVHEVASAGRRDFVSRRRIRAHRYELQVAASVAGDARRLLAATAPGASI